MGLKNSLPPALPHAIYKKVYSLYPCEVVHPSSLSVVIACNRVYYLRFYFVEGWGMLSYVYYLRDRMLTQQTNHSTEKNHSNLPQQPQHSKRVL